MWALSGCLCGKQASGFGMPCAPPASTRPDVDLVNTLAAECETQVCLANAVADGGTRTAYCSGPCAGDSDCAATGFVTHAGTCRTANETGTTKFCWFE